jgi:hypothetical protein
LWWKAYIINLIHQTCERIECPFLKLDIEINVKQTKKGSKVDSEKLLALISTGKASGRRPTIDDIFSCKLSIPLVSDVGANGFVKHFRDMMSRHSQNRLDRFQ